jgi:hypothetical protein
LAVIHYHGVKLSGGPDVQIALSRRHACISFGSSVDEALIAEVVQSFILDNGAFSAWKSGVPFDLDGFMAWAAHWMRHPACDWALAPDVIDGTEQQNDDLLSDLPMDGRWAPVWHLHESLERLERLCDQWPRVAIGSSGAYAQIGTQAWWCRMAEAMDVATDRDGHPLAKLHGLRMLDPTVFSHYPFSSADSTNVARNIGIDSAWTGAYAPRSRHTRALIMMERIELHASASRWSRSGAGKNLELFG